MHAKDARDRGAAIVRELLEAIGLKPLVKTTGGYGLHVVVPLAAGYSYDTAKVFAEIVARRAADAARRARDAAAHDRKARRRTRSISITFKSGKARRSSRPTRCAPATAPRSRRRCTGARSRPSRDGATTAAPADEFAKFTIAYDAERLAREGDLWGPKAWKKQRLEAAIDKAQRLW